jgi:hypothetical protein
MENHATQKIIVVGASHCKKLVHAISDHNIDVVDLTVPGWTPTPANIASLSAKLSEVGIESNSIVVIDVLSNSIYRFEQYDGSLSLPFKSNGVHHMGGKVSICGKEAVFNTLLCTKEIFAKIPGFKIVLPPLPRYIFGPCCSDVNHCIDVGKPEYIHQMLESSTGLRKTIQDGLVKTGVTDFSVPDLLQQLLDEKSDTKKMAEKLKGITAQDNVHLTLLGYAKMADVVLKLIEEKRSAAALNVSGPAAASGPGYYWRGFLSPVGTTRVKHGAQTYKQARFGGGKWRGNAHHWNNPMGAGRGRGSYRRGR